MLVIWSVKKVGVGWGGGGPPPKFFLALWASYWAENKGDTGPQGPSPGSATSVKFKAQQQQQQQQLTTRLSPNTLEVKT